LVALVLFLFNALWVPFLWMRVVSSFERIPRLAAFVESILFGGSLILMAGMASSRLLHLILLMPTAWFFYFQLISRSKIYPTARLCVAGCVGVVGGTVFVGWNWWPM